MRDSQSAKKKELDEPASGFGDVLFDELKQISIRRGLAPLIWARKRLRICSERGILGERGASAPCPETRRQGADVARSPLSGQTLSRICGVDEGRPDGRHS